LAEIFNQSFGIAICDSHGKSSTFLFNEFLNVFAKIKKEPKINLIIFKTFPSTREKNLILTIKKLKTDLDLAKKLDLLYFDNESKLINFLKKKLKPKTIIATIGAGDVYKILEKITL